MNKRQAKKAFKKVYGISPKQFAKVANDFSKVDWVRVGELASDSIKIISEEIKRLSARLPEIMQEILGRSEENAK